MEQTPLGSVRFSGIAYRKIEELEIIEKAGILMQMTINMKARRGIYMDIVFARESVSAVRERLKSGLRPRINI